LRLESIFGNYDKVLMMDSDRPFPRDFSQEDRDIFYRLKFRAMTRMIDGNAGGQQLFPRPVSSIDVRGEEEEKKSEHDAAEELDFSRVGDGN
jgi:hypothetical protein